MSSVIFWVIEKLIFIVGKSIFKRKIYICIFNTSRQGYLWDLINGKCFAGDKAEGAGSV